MQIADNISEDAFVLEGSSEKTKAYIVQEALALFCTVNGRVLLADGIL